MDKDIEEVKTKIIKALKPLKLSGNVDFTTSNSLSFPHDLTATFINIKRKNFIVIIELMSPVLMNISNDKGLLEFCNSYNLESRFTLVYNNAIENNMLLLRTEFWSEFFVAEDFAIKIRSMKNDSETLIKELKSRFLGRTYSEFQGI
jgi:hypothetical protein